MIKRVIQDYFLAFRGSNFKKIWKKEITSSLNILILAYLWNLLLSLITGKWKWEEFIIGIVFFIPFVYSVSDRILHPISMQKMMYLCPMEETERRTYIYTSYVVRIVIDALVAIFCLCIGAALLPLHLSIPKILIAFWNDVTFSIVIESNEEKGGAGWCDIFLTWIAVFLNMLLFSAEYVGEWIVVLSLCLIQIILLNIYRRYVKRALQAAIRYDKTEVIK
ncbi:MAG: hypothetical protein ACI4HI_17270 [Lachnospiraceae bacterium]